MIYKVKIVILFPLNKKILLLQRCVRIFFLPVSFGPASNASLGKNLVFYGFNDQKN